MVGAAMEVTVLNVESELVSVEFYSVEFDVELEASVEFVSFAAVAFIISNLKENDAVLLDMLSESSMATLCTPMSVSVGCLLRMNISDDESYSMGPLVETSICTTAPSSGISKHVAHSDSVISSSGSMSEGIAYSHDSSNLMVKSLVNDSTKANGIASERA